MFELNHSASFPGRLAPAEGLQHLLHRLDRLAILELEGGMDIAVTRRLVRMRHGEHLATFPPVVGQGRAVAGLGAVGVGQLLGGEVAKLVEDARVPMREPLRHREIDGARREHAGGHEVDHFLHPVLPHGRDLLGQQPVEQWQRSQQRAAGRLVDHLEDVSAAGAWVTPRLAAIRLHREHVSLQRERCCLRHGMHLPEGRCCSGLWPCSSPFPSAYSAIPEMVNWT
ncbi:MAG: hypothetical protein AW07_04031 [Candidatus Accumulibacter sp. SK-11]|nr:MAG: hypothetical protein AW07_04031 [Candidatus Accumulibacter sp. SK-11]